MKEQEQIDVAVCPPLQKRLFYNCPPGGAVKEMGQMKRNKMPFPLSTNRPVHPSLCSYMEVIMNSALTALILYYWFVITFQ